MRGGLAWGAVAAAACGGAHEGGAGAVCQGYCSYYARCSGPVGSDCVGACISSNLGEFQRFNEPYLSRLGPCIGAAACNSDTKKAVEPCHAAAVQALSPSGALVEACRALAPTFFECNWQTADLSSCTTSMGSLSDLLVSRAASMCAASSCQNLETCLNDATGGTR